MLPVQALLESLTCMRIMGLGGRDDITTRFVSMFETNSSTFVAPNHGLPTIADRFGTPSQLQVKGPCRRMLALLT